MFEYDDNATSYNNQELLQTQSLSEIDSDSDAEIDVKSDTEIDVKSDVKNNFKQKNKSEPMPTPSPEKELSADDIEELRELLKNWLELDETSKELSDRVKDIKMEKKQYETYILAFMEKTNKETIKASDSNLVLRKDVKETRAKPNEENILKVLTRVLGNATQAYKFTQEIIEDAPLKETITLKKETNKSNKSNQLKKPKRAIKKI